VSVIKVLAEKLCREGRGEFQGLDIAPIVQDLLKFGNSSREYVLLHENAAEEG
jgi:hypothetical protein